MWWVKDWVLCIMQEVFSVHVAVAREGPTTRQGRSYAVWRFLAGVLASNQHTRPLGSPALQIFRMDGNGTGGTETNSHRGVEGGKLSY
jgi:hypothetical protein